MDQRRLTAVTEYQMLAKNAEGEAEIHNLEARRYEVAPELPELPTALPARITPSRAKVPKRDYTSIYVFSDTQIGYRRIGESLESMHDERAMAVSRLICKDLRPDVIVNCGDTIDLPELSRFAPDSDHFYRTMQPSFQAVHNMYAELRADNPQAKIVEVGSNHIKRLSDFVLKNMPAMYGMKRPGEDTPVLSYPFLANLDHVGVDFIDGYGQATYEYKEDLAFIHGTFSVSNGSTAAKLSKQNQDRNIIQGHAHRVESQYSTTRKGRVMGAFVVGALCRNDGYVPAFHSAINGENKPVAYHENWQQGVMHIRDYGNGNYQFDHILIQDGQAFYNGKEYTDAPG